MLQVGKALETIKNTQRLVLAGQEGQGGAHCRRAVGPDLGGDGGPGQRAMHVDPGIKDCKDTRAEVETLIPMTAALLCIVP